MGNVFIIGNGFDLDLGLPTKYSDFANSEYWPVSESENNSVKEVEKKEAHSIKTPTLEDAIETAKNRETWFDLEGELLEYSKLRDEIKHKFYVLSNRESPNNVKKSVDFSTEEGCADLISDLRKAAKATVPAIFPIV